MHTMLMQNVEYSYVVVSRKYTNFASFFFFWDVECVPGKINTNLPHKIRDTNKRDDIAAKLVPKSLHIQHKMLFGNKHKSPMKKGNL